MTAARYKVPASFLGLAGSRLGLDLLDLFKEDEQGRQGFEGFAPGFQTSSIEKGRGGVLGYKAPRMATRETTFQLMPETSGLGVNVSAAGGSSTVNMPAATTQTPVTPEPKKDTRPGIASTYGASPVYFGHQDYFRNLELGYTPEEIKKYIQANPQLMNPASTNVQGKGGLYDQIMSGNVQFPGTATVTPPASTPPAQPKFENPLQTQEFVHAPSSPAPKAGISTGYGISSQYFGDEDLEAARESGYSDREIKEFLDQNISGLLREGNLPGKGGVYDKLRL